MHRWALAGLVAMAACVSIPPYEAPNGVSWLKDPTGGGGTASGPSFTVHFAGGGDTGFHYPDSIKLAGTEIIGHSAAAGCAGEDQVGLALYPSARLSPTTIAMADASALAGTLLGPAVVRVDLGANAPFMCGTTPVISRRPTATSTFTFFPDGEIARFDQMLESGATPITQPADCQCQMNGGNQFFITSFWTFDQSKFTGMLHYNPVTVQLPITSNIPDDTGTTQCIDTPGVRAAGVSWPGPTRVTAPTQATTPGTIAFVHDFLPKGSRLDDLDSTAFTVTSALFLDPAGDCGGAVATGLQTFTKYNMLTVNGGDVSRAFDGIYGGGGDPIQVSGVVHIHGPFTGSFAVWFHWDDSLDTLPRVTSSESSKTGQWFIPQRLDEHETIVWFRAGLIDDEEITIDPR